MRWVDATRVVALVAYMATCFNFSFVKKLKRIAVRKNLPVLFGAPKKTVSAPILIAYPLPALSVITGSKFFKKSKIRWVSFSYHSLVMGNITGKVKGVQ
jgi:hypothetical protein